MRKYLILIVCAFVAVTSLRAEVVILHSGKRVEGQILFQNEEVIVIRDAGGARFQYPRADIKDVFSNEEAPVVEQIVELPEEEEPAKKASIRLELTGGGATLPHESWGGNIGVDLLVGTHQLLGRRIMLGGGVGYHAYIFPVEGARKPMAYSFLPIVLAARVPLIEGKHAPLIGATMGYGVALSKSYRGGLHAGLDVGWQYLISDKSALFLGANAQFQQAILDAVDTPDVENLDKQYKNHTGRSIVTIGLKLGVSF